MKKIIALLAVLGMTVAAFAQQALGPGTGLVSPEINPDHSVTFRLFAPKAKIVQLTGDFLPTRPVEYERGGQKLTYDAPGIVDLKEGRDGVWTWTSAPLEGELYSYSFLVDGRKTMDPVSYTHLDVYKRQILYMIAIIALVWIPLVSVKCTVDEEDGTLFTPENKKRPMRIADIDRITRVTNRKGKLRYLNIHEAGVRFVDVRLLPAQADALIGHLVRINPDITVQSRNYF